MAVRDDAVQVRSADAFFAEITEVAVSTQSLCELVWVLRRSYRFSRQDAVIAVETILSQSRVVVDRPAAEAGLRALKAGADFADGVIAHEGRLLGAELFVSFDRKAVSTLAACGYATRLLS